MADKTPRDLLTLARQRFKTCADAESVQRQAMLEDKEFRAGRQWPDQVQAARELDKRPCLTIDKLSGPLRQITNAQRQSRFAIDVVPQGDGDPEVAEIFQGLVRHVEVESNALAAYSWAFEDAVTCGKGFWRILTDYADDGSFDQDLKIRRILNPFTVYVDPSAEEPDLSDARFMFVVEDVPLDEYRQRYPKSQAASGSLEQFEALGDRSPDWHPEGKIRIAEYWYRERRPKQVAKLADGRVVTVEGDGLGNGDLDGVPVLDTRDVDAYVVKWALINAVEVLDEAEWPGRYIPIVPVLGEELNVGGERIFRGIIRSARDAQRMYNYWVSAETEAIALAPRAPFVGAEGQFEGHEAQWKTSNLRSYPYLEYKPTTIAGQIVAPPQRQIAEPPIQALVAAVMQADQDIKATTGLFDPSLGNISSKERSGRAILALQKQGETINSNYLDNLARSITHTGRILVDLIPAIFDRPGRVVRVLGADEQAKSVAVNAPFVEGPQGQPQLMPAPLPGTKTYDLRKGRYAVRVQVGPSYNTQRQETAAAMMEIVGGNPALMPMVGDLLFANMDWPGAQAMSERLKKMLPPQLQDDKGSQQIPPQVQAQMQQAGQLVEVLTQRVNELTDAIQTDVVKASRDAEIKRMEIESRERIAAMQTQADLIKTEATINAQASQKLIAEQLAGLRQMIELGHEAQLTREGQQHEATQAEAQRAYEAEQADQERLYGAMTLGADQAHQGRQAEAQRAHEAEQSDLERQTTTAENEADRALAQEQAKMQAKAKAKAPGSAR